MSEQGDTRTFKGQRQICAGPCEVCGKPVWRYLDGGPIVHRAHYTGWPPQREEWDEPPPRIRYVVVDPWLLILLFVVVLANVLGIL